MKLLSNTNSTDVVKKYFGCEMPSRSIKNKFDKFILKHNCVENVFCKNTVML